MKDFVQILGNQDTLYVGAKGWGQPSGPECVATRSYFRDCVVSGHMHFIYGDGIAFFDHCEIHNTTHAAGGSVAAQGKHYVQRAVDRADAATFAPDAVLSGTMGGSRSQCAKSAGA